MQISSSKLNQIIFYKQKLSAPVDDPMQAVESLFAIQNQYPSTACQVLWARTKKYTPGWIEEKLYTEKSLIKTWNLRWTIHIIKTQDLPVLISSCNAFYYQRISSILLKQKKLSQERIEELNSEIKSFLCDSPVTKEYIHSKIPHLTENFGDSWGSEFKLLSFKGLLNIVTGKKNKTGFVRTDMWIGKSLPVIDIKQAYGILLEKYLNGYGPAQISEFAYWAGVQKKHAETAVNSIKHKLIKIYDKNKKEFLMLKQDLSLLEDTLPEIPEILILPKFDVLNLFSKNKLIVTDDSIKKLIFRKAGQIEAVILINGLAGGTWRMTKTSSKISYNICMFGKISKKIKMELERRFFSLADLYGIKECSFVYE